MRLRAATAKPSKGPTTGLPLLGYTWFANGRAASLIGLMYAAGIAWENALGEDSPGDRKLIRELGYDPTCMRGLVRASAAMLRDLAGPHAKVTRALLERNLGAADIARLARGEPLRSEED
jgi:hypothetical protein